MKCEKVLCETRRKINNEQEMTKWLEQQGEKGREDEELAALSKMRRRCPTKNGYTSPYANRMCRESKSTCVSVRGERKKIIKDRIWSR